MINTILMQESGDSSFESPLSFFEFRNNEINHSPLTINHY